MRSVTRATLLALAAAGCGPYTNVAQKLDVTARVVGDTWIAKGDPWETRVLLIGKPDADGRAPFSFSSVVVALSRGTSVYTLQGTWTEVGTTGALLDVNYEYTMPDESSNPDIWSRHGTERSSSSTKMSLTAMRSGSQLVVSGNSTIAGTYVPLVEALGNLSSQAPTPSDEAACAFQVANLGMLRSQGRILGFGGGTMTTYWNAATFIGTVSGSLTITLVGLSNNTTTIQYDQFEDIGGVIVDGPMITDANDKGTGSMRGVTAFTFKPVAADGTPGSEITGTIDYGAGDNAVKIDNGNADGGYYTIAIAGGGTALVAPATPPSPSVWDCLARP